MTDLAHSYLGIHSWIAGVHGQFPICNARSVFLIMLDRGPAQVNVMPSSGHPPLGGRDYLALACFAGSWAVELSESLLHLAQ
jgi:hypothetical protein